jgi:hypothetical protein
MQNLANVKTPVKLLTRTSITYLTAPENKRQNDYSSMNSEYGNRFTIPSVKNETI